MAAPRDALLRVVREVIAPLIEADGGEIYLVGLDQDAIRLHLAGRYAGCPGTTLSRDKLIEPLLLKANPKLRVEITSGALIPPGAKRLP